MVTGMGVISPLGQNPAAFFENLLTGVSGVRRLPDEFRKRLSVTVAAPAAFDAARHFSESRLRILDRVSQFAIVAAGQALSDSRLELATEDREGIGVYLGTGMGGAETTDEGYATFYGRGSDRVPPYTVLMSMNNAPASWIALEHGLGGPNITYSTACSSSAVAVGEAYRAIRSGEAEVMFAGGSEAPLTQGTLKAWDALRTLAIEDPEDPARSCKPFAKDRTGLVLGEGAAVLLLESLDHAQKRGAPIRGEIGGYGLCTDCNHITRPSVAGQARAMRLALADAAATPADIDYINAHGTGTLQNDAVETQAIKEVFGDRARHIPVSATKSMHGHLLGAAGAMELVATLLAVRRSAIPPTINLHIPDPDCDLDYVRDRSRERVDIGLALSNSFAFGGTNAVLVARAMERAREIA